MKKHYLIPLCGLLPAISIAAKNPVRPNVILLVADDLGYGDLSCYGATRISTPHVDSIAKGGVRFTNAHAVASTSTPARFSLLTGEYCYRRQGTNIASGDAGMIIRPEFYTIADMFKSCGYHTAAIGKWHLGLGSETGKQDWNNKLDVGLSDIGFDYSYIMAATGDRVPCVFIENGRVANYDASAPIQVSYRKNFDGEPTGRNHPELLYNMKPSVNHGHDQSIVNGISRIGYMKGGGKALWKDENIADSIVGRAVKYMEDNKNHPFFMYLATNDVHVPRLPHERFRGKSPMGLRGEAILEFDWAVGQVANALKRLGIADNTILIITSDNGPVIDDGYQDEAVTRLGNHKPSGPFRGGKYSTFEAGTTVPFIVNWPKGAACGKVSNALVSHIDDIASLGSLIGANIPANKAPDSRNYLNTWLGKSNKSCEYVMEMAADRTLSVRSGKWKYIEPSNGQPLSWMSNVETGYNKKPQLYNIANSKYESNNEYSSQPQIAKKMVELLEQARKPIEINN